MFRMLFVVLDDVTASCYLIRWRVLLMSRVFFLKSKSFGVKARNYPKRIIDRYELFLENESVKSMIIEYVVSDFYIFLILFISHEFYLPELLERNIDDMKAFWYVSDGNEKTTKKIFSNLFRMIYTENKSDVQIEVEVNLMYDRLEKMVKKKQKRKICQISKRVTSKLWG